MKKMIAKMRKIKTTRWNKLTTGEKVASIVMGLVKWAVIAAIGIAVIGSVIAVIIGVVIALSIGSAISGGFTNASRAYRPGDRNVRFW